MKKSIRKKLVWFLVMIFSSIFVMGGCSSSKSNENVTTKKDASTYKIVLLLPGPINDQSWNATNYAGLVKCNKTLNTKIEYVENVQAADFESTFRNYAERGYDLIIAAGTQFDDAANKVAKTYPKTKFCVVNGQVSSGSNVAPVFPKEYEASYIAALIAGNITKNGQFACIGGFPNDAMNKLLDVYEKTSVNVAAKRGIPNSKSVRAYANSWDNVTLGKQLASTMIDKGADVMFVYANQVGLGSIQAAKEKGVKFVGFASDQTKIDPNTVVASVVEDFSTLYVWTIQKFMNGTLAGNQVHAAGIAEKIFYPVYTKNVSKEIQDKVAAGIDDVAKGKVNFTPMFKK